MPTPLGSLEPVDLRTIWPDEARDFTPWLAQEENLRRLSDALNLELELDRVEAAVGPYSADIVATDASSNTKVVIENQLEKTNHDHLGKVLTYASGLEAELAYIVPRVPELTNTAHDMKPWAEDLGHHGPPFGEHRTRRLVLEAWDALAR